MRSVAIIVPTFNQPDHLYLTLSTLCRFTRSSFHVYVVDNSEDGYAEGVANRCGGNITVLRSDKNLGWMGGINAGINASTEEFVMFLNDDVRILDFDHLWLQRLLDTFANHPECGVAVPSSNAVMGHQNFMIEAPAAKLITSCVSGFCVLTKRSIIDQVGLLDESLPGGDDIDFSIRVRKAGYRLFIRRDVFVYHFCSVTGNSVYGSNWNSPEYKEELDRALIQKHGLSEYITAVSFAEKEPPSLEPPVDWEREAMVRWCVGKGIDIGCGNRKVVPEAIGIDVTPPGEKGLAGSQLGAVSEADMTYDGKVLPFETESLDYVHARHVLEHVVDLVETLREWTRVIKDGGYLILACPDENVVDGLPLDPSHKHALTADAVINLIDAIYPDVLEYETIERVESDISFVVVFRVRK